MNRIVEIISTKLDALNRQIVKFRGSGRDDIQEVVSISQYGIDSVPVSKLIALQAKTQVSGESVIVGFILSDRVAEIGETRVYSTDEDGVLQTYIHLKNDGTIDFGGQGDFLTRFTPTEATIVEIQNDITTLKNILSTWVPVPNDGGAALKAAAATWAATPLIESISDAKISEFNTFT
jgi:hypothetical protein